jgi:starch synthase
LAVTLAFHQVGYFHGYIDGVDFVFVDHPAFHYVADSIYGGDRQAITWRCALLCKVGF